MMAPLKRYELSQQIRNAMAAKVRASLNESAAAVERAIMILFERQTWAEKSQEATFEDNALGVKHQHGKRIAYYGKWLKSGKHLTGHHVDFARRIAHTYARTQLAELAAVKAGIIPE